MSKTVQKVFTDERVSDFIDAEGKTTNYILCWDDRRKHTDILIVANAEDLRFDHATVTKDEITFIIRKGAQLQFAAVGDKGIFHYDEEEEETF